MAKGGTQERGTTSGSHGSFLTTKILKLLSVEILTVVRVHPIHTQSKISEIYDREGNLVVTNLFLPLQLLDRRLRMLRTMT